MKKSGDLNAEQANKVMLAEQPGHGTEVFRSSLWNKKSLACSSVSVTMDLLVLGHIEDDGKILNRVP